MYTTKTPIMYLAQKAKTPSSLTKSRFHLSGSARSRPPAIAASGLATAHSSRSVPAGALREIPYQYFFAAYPYTKEPLKCAL